MAEHTPGPWTRDAERDGRTRFDSAVVRGPNGNFIAEALDFNRTDRDAEVEANARLISAAPDLLAALTAQRCFECRQWLELVARVIERIPCDVCAPAMAAIAKATGKEAADVASE